MSLSRSIGSSRIEPLLAWPRYACTVAWTALGLGDRRRNPDRVLLEQVILPGYAARPDIVQVLFVGCEAYTRDYRRHFAADTGYWTLEPDPAKSRFGAAGHHHVAGLQEIGRCFAPGALDLIVCNGVWGWGLDARSDCETAFGGCHAALRDGGCLLLGWNDLPGRRPMRLESLRSLARFDRDRFGPLEGADRWLANPTNRHVYDFFVKPGSGLRDAAPAGAVARHPAKPARRP